MPKSHKRKKNPGVGIDFKRAKHKVGRKLPKAQNETDTSVRASRLVLAEQSVAVDKSGVATTSRNVSLKELLGQCRHYSDKVRLKALNGLIELLKEHPSEGKVHGSEIVTMTADRAGDTDVSCREAYCTFLQTALFPALGEHALQPFLPLMMGHICSAMTHLNHSIRSSGIDMMNVVLDWRPDIVGQRYFCEICQHYIDSLGRSSRGRSLSAGSLKTLLCLAEGCLKFLRSTLPYVPGGSFSHNENRIPQDNRKSSSVLLNSSKRHWDTARDALSVTARENGDVNAQHASKLLVLLLECWEECGLTAPDDVAGQGERGVSAEICGCRILECCTLLMAKYRGSSMGKPFGDVSHRILSRVFPYFPKIETLQGNIRDIDAIAADLISKIILELLQSTSDVEEQGLVEQATERLFLWSKLCLDHGAFSQGMKLGSHLIYYLDESSRNSLLQAIVTGWKTSDVQCNERNQGLKLLGTILRPALAHHNPDQGILDLPKNLVATKVVVDSSSDEIFAEWLSDIPSFLWKLGKSSSQAYTYGLGLSALLNASRFLEIRSSISLPKIKCELESLTSKIVPLFALKMKNKLIPGPLVNMPIHVQELAVDVLYHLPGLHKNALQMISICIESKTMYSFDLLERLLELIYFKSQYGDPEHVWNFIYAALRGPGDPTATSSNDWETDLFIVDRVSQVALHCSPPALALQAVLPALLDEQKQLSTIAQKVRAAYGILFFLHKAMRICVGDISDVNISSSQLTRLLHLSSLSHMLADDNIDQEMIRHLQNISQQATKSMVEHLPEQYLDGIVEYMDTVDESRSQSLSAILQNLQWVLDSGLEPRSLATLKSASSNKKLKAALDNRAARKDTPEETKRIIEKVVYIYSIVIPQ